MGNDKMRDAMQQALLDKQNEMRGKEFYKAVVDKVFGALTDANTGEVLGHVSPPKIASEQQAAYEKYRLDEYVRERNIRPVGKMPELAMGYQFPDRPVMPVSPAFFDDGQRAAGTLDSFVLCTTKEIAAFASDEAYLTRWERIQFRLWLLRLTVIAWALEIMGPTYKANKDYIWGQPDAWIGFWIDGYSPLDAIEEDQSCA